MWGKFITHAVKVCGLDVGLHVVTFLKWTPYVWVVYDKVGSLQYTPQNKQVPLQHSNYSSRYGFNLLPTTQKKAHIENHHFGLP